MKNIINKNSNNFRRDTGFSRTIEDLFYNNFFESEYQMIRELPNYYHLSIPVPGMSKNDLTLRLEDRLLIVEGRRKYEWQSDTAHSNSMTNYRRSMYLPVEADSDQIKAKVKNGMLSVKIFKHKQHGSTKTIPVTGDDKMNLTKNNIWPKNVVQNLKNNFRKLFK